MKRLFTMSALTSSLLVAGGLGLASCNDELDIAADVATLPDDLANDLTCGWNLFVWNADTLQQCSIPLNTNLPVVVKSKNSSLNYDQVLDSNGRPVLRPHLSGVAVLPETIQSDQLHLSVEGHPELGEKVVNLFLHPTIEKDTRANEPLTFDQRILERARKIFSFGCNYSNGLASICSYPWFDFGDKLKDYVMVQDIQDVKGTYEEHMIDNLTQDRTRWDVGVTVGGAYPFNIGLLTGTIKVNRTEEDKTIDKSHYLTGIRTERAANVTLLWPSLLDEDTNTGLPLYFAYLRTEFRNVLNNPGSPQYEEYLPKPEEGEASKMDGIFRLLNDYGTVFPTQAALGGRGKFVVKREEHIHEHSLAVSVSVAAKLAHHYEEEGNINPDGVDGQKLKSLIDLQKFRNEILSEQMKSEAELCVNVGYNNESLTSLVKNDTYFEFEGGRAGSKPTDWIFDRDTPEQWAVVDFQRAQSPVAMPMKSIELFFTDPESERCQLVKAALENRAYPIDSEELESTSGGAADNDGDVYWTNPYYHYRDSVNGLLNLTGRRLVLADLVYVRTEKTKAWQPKQFRGPDNKLRTYYPVRANIFSPEASDVNYRLNTDGQAYCQPNWHLFGGDWDRYHNKYNHAWYYALDYEDQCPGVLEIQFLKKDENPSWWRNDNGVRNDDGMTPDSDPFLWVALKIGQGMKTPYEDKIKAIGFYAYEGRKKGCVFGASPMWNDLPYWAEENSQEAKTFNELWQKEYDNGNHTSREFATYEWRQDTRFQLVWSKEPLIPIRSYYKVVGGVDNAEAFKNALPMHPQKK